MHSQDNSPLIKQVEKWLTDAVIALGLCPFAAHPHQHKQVRISHYQGKADEHLLQFILNEVALLEDCTKGQNNYIETSLLCVSDDLDNFLNFNDFVGLAEDLLIDEGYEGLYQIASFHPNYQFAGTTPDDRENLTNRAPCPIFHLIRENSLEQALKHHKNPEEIYTHNIKTVNSLSETQLKQLFPYLFGHAK